MAVWAGMAEQAGEGAVSGMTNASPVDPYACWWLTQSQPSGLAGYGGVSGYGRASGDIVSLSLFYTYMKSKSKTGYVFVSQRLNRARIKFTVLQWTVIKQLYQCRFFTYAVPLLISLAAIAQRPAATSIMQLCISMWSFERELYQPLSDEQAMEACTYP